MDGIRERIYCVQKQLKVARPDHNEYWIPRPKGMHNEKYKQLLKEMHKLQEDHERMFISEMTSRFGIK